MATSKSTVKRTTKSSSKTPVKKAAPRKGAAKPATKTARNTLKRTKTSQAAARTPEMKSFRVASDAPFTQFSISKQTVYWVILICFIVFAQLWVLKLQLEVADLIDQQQQQLQSLQDSGPIPKKR